MIKKFLRMTALAALLVAPAVPALATSWFTAAPKPNSIAAPATTAAAAKPAETYQPYRALAIVNPGGWGSPGEEKYLTNEDKAYLIKVMQSHRELAAELKAEKAQAMEQSKIAQRNALSRQNTANSIKPLGTPQAVPAGQQQDRAPRKMPTKVPVAEWEKLNQQNGQSSAP